MDEEYTFKNYYFPPTSPSLDDDETKESRKRQLVIDEPSIEAFFEGNKKIKKQKKFMSSHVARVDKNGSVSYLSSGADDGTSATHLIKMEIYDLKKLANIPTNEHWKNADVRVKYYAKSAKNQHFQKTKALIFNVTEEIFGSKDCKKYTF